MCPRFSQDCTTFWPEEATAQYHLRQRPTLLLYTAPPQKKTKKDPRPFPICQDRKTRFPSSWTTGPLLQGPDLLFASKPEPRVQEALGHHTAQQGPRFVDTGLPAWAAEGHPSTRSLRSPPTAIPRAPAWQPGGHIPSSRCQPRKAACGVSEEMPTHPSVPQRHVYCSPQHSRACSVARTDFPFMGHQNALHFILHTPNSGADRPSFESLLVLPPISCVSWDKILYLSLSLNQNTGIIRAPTHHRFIPREETQTEYKHSTDIGKH